MVMILVICAINQFTSIFRNTSLIYYCNYILGTYNDGITPTILQVIGGLPMGLGMFAIIPLSKKLEKRTLFLAGFSMVIVGNLICLLNPANMAIVIIGQIIKSLGGVPVSYIFMAIFADCLDCFELRHHFRCDGFAMSVYSIILTIMTGICTSLFNLILGQTGYAAPSIVDGVTVAAVQSQVTLNGILWSYYGIETIGTPIIIILFFFLRAERELKQAKLQRLS